MALTCVAIVLSGCGLTGDLYLPEDAEPGADAQLPPTEEDDTDAEADEG